MALGAQSQWNGTLVAAVAIDTGSRGSHMPAAVAAGTGLSGMDEVGIGTTVAARTGRDAIDLAELVGTRGGCSLLGRVDESESSCRA